MDIFYKNQVNAGTLSVFTLPQVRGQANLFFFNSPAPQGQTFIPGAVITGVDYQQQTNTQFQRSLDNTIYVYSFGDQMGNMQIKGMLFPRNCKDNKNGIQEIQKFYQQNRVSRSVDRVRVTLSNETIEGFLIGMAISTADVSAGIHSFQLLLRSIPLAFSVRSGGSGGGASAGGGDSENTGDLEGELV